MIYIPYRIITHKKSTLPDVPLYILNYYILLLYEYIKALSSLLKQGFNFINAVYQANVALKYTESKLRWQMRTSGNMLSWQNFSGFVQDEGHLAKYSERCGWWMSGYTCFSLSIVVLCFAFSGWDTEVNMRCLETLKSLFETQSQPYGQSCGSRMCFF